MTKQLLNTLYLTTEGAHARLENDNVRVECEGETLLKVPLHHLGAIHVLGIASISTPLMMRCAEDGRAVALFDRNGHFRARVHGKTTGNILLRKAQYDGCCDPFRCLDFARQIVAGKLQNSRQVLMRAARESVPEPFADSIAEHEGLLGMVQGTKTLDELRGLEGMGAKGYFACFPAMIRAQKTAFQFKDRNRRPPRDRVNAVLSFLYSIATSDCVSALEGVGLDPQMGILHAVRPGRPALGLDLLEEFRSIVLDRLCLTLINRRQLQPDHFDVRPGDSVLLNDIGRKLVLIEYQKRKQIEVRHALLESKVPIGLLPHLQARLMARVFRGELHAYPPYLPD